MTWLLTITLCKAKTTQHIALVLQSFQFPLKLLRFLFLSLRMSHTDRAVGIPRHGSRAVMGGTALFT